MLLFCRRFFTWFSMVINRCYNIFTMFDCRWFKTWSLLIVCSLFLGCNRYVGTFPSNRCFNGFISFTLRIFWIYTWSVMFSKWPVWKFYETSFRYHAGDASFCIFISCFIFFWYRWCTSNSCNYDLWNASNYKINKFRNTASSCSNYRKCNCIRLE